MTTNKPFISKTIFALKERLSKSQTLQIQNEEGYLSTVNFSFNEPLKFDEIVKFEKETKWMIPNDLREFLLTHNGCVLFNDIKYAGGIEIFCLEEMKKNI